MVKTKTKEIAVTNISEEIIGPELAQKYLNYAAPNRRVRDGTVSQYARDMFAGRWFPSLIRFDDKGNLVDGQHRLRAILASKTEQIFYVERNTPSDAIHSIDVGLRRTIGDAFSIAGETNSNTLASAVRIASHLENFPGTPPASWTRTPMSTEEAFQYLADNPRIRHSTAIGAEVARQIHFPPSLATALHYLEMKRSIPYAEEFWAKMISGAELTEGTGPYALRKLVIEDRLRPKGTQMDQNMLYAVSIKGWNFWEYDKAVRQLRWLRGASEPFPYLGQKPKGSSESTANNDE